MKREKRQESERDRSPVGLVADFERCVQRRDSNYWKRLQVNIETRMCIWEGQSWDGRKWSEKTRKKVFPWEGSSDARVPLVDHRIHADVELLMLAWKTQKIIARATNQASAAQRAFAISTLLRWQLYTDIPDAEEEAEYLANLLLERGAAVMGVYWDRREQVVREEIRLPDLQMAAREALQRIAGGDSNPVLPIQASIPELILDPSREAEAVMMLRQVVGSEDLEDQRFRKLLKDLRETGEGKFPRRIVAVDRPALRTLALNEDLFVPPENTCIERARMVFLREVLSEADMQERVRSMDYDADWVDKVVETQRGRMSITQNDRAGTRSNRTRGLADESQLFEVVTAYERLYDEDGVQMVKATVFNPGVASASTSGGELEAGKEELIDDAHGGYPFVLFTTERRTRLIDDARGYGERAHTMQAQVKEQWDGRLNRAHVATLPPSHCPPGEEPDAWGPGVNIETMQPERFGYFDIPKYDVGSKEIEESISRFMAEMFGAKTESGDPVDATNIRQGLVRRWLRGWMHVGTLLVKLDQQYLPDEVWVNVVGTYQGKSVRVGRDEIQGPFSLMLDFQVKHLDPEFTTELIGLMTQVLAMDTTGRVDRSEAVQAAMELIDPSYAERLLKPSEAASLDQIDDEKKVLAQLLLGIPVDVRGDEAFGLRLQALMKTVQSSPTVQTLIRANPQVAEMVNLRAKQLEFNRVQREENPEIGRRLGTKPMEKAVAAEPAAPSEGGGA